MESNNTKGFYCHHFDSGGFKKCNTQCEDCTPSKEVERGEGEKLAEEMPEAIIILHKNFAPTTPNVLKSMKEYRESSAPLPEGKGVDIKEVLRKGVNIGMQNVKQPRFEGDFNFNNAKALKECGEYLSTLATPSLPPSEEKGVDIYTFDDIARAIVFGIEVEAGVIPRLYKEYPTLVDQFLQHLKTINNGK